MPCFGKPKREDERCAGQRYDGTKGEETYMYMYIFTYIYNYFGSNSLVLKSDAFARLWFAKFKESIVLDQ